MLKFDPKLPVQTRDGRKARIICTDLKEYVHGDTIMALIEQDDGSETWATHTSSGLYVKGSEDKIDLVNIPEKRWAVLLSDGTWIEEDEPMRQAQIIPYDGRGGKPPHPIACLEFTEGEGL